MRIEEERLDVMQNLEFAAAQRLVKSVNKWTKNRGRKGYLDFMAQFVK